ncbi:hypothetical protein [Fluviicola sp.]|uniref:hypothetical protein n=1 Tax=Fluviicola sp. TaxID=1917219 RepID=UPI0031D6A047
MFAFELMKQEFSGYRYEQFLDDLRFRTPPRKRKGKSGLARFGRYGRMEQLRAQYLITGNLDFAIQAKRLRERMSKPYRVRFRQEGQVYEYHFSALIPIGRIEKLVTELAECQSLENAEKIIREFTASSHIN